MASKRARSRPADHVGIVQRGVRKFVLIQNPAGPSFVDVRGPGLIQPDARQPQRRAEILRYRGVLYGDVEAARRGGPGLAECAGDRRIVGPTWSEPPRGPDQVNAALLPSAAGSRSPRSAPRVYGKRRFTPLRSAATA